MHPTAVVRVGSTDVVANGIRPKALDVDVEVLPLSPLNWTDETLMAPSLDFLPRKRLRGEKILLAMPLDGEFKSSGVMVGAGVVDRESVSQLAVEEVGR